MLSVSVIKKVWDSPTITTWVSLATSSLKNLIFIPLVVSVYTTTEVATWFLFLSVVSISNLFDLGFYSAGSRLVSYIMGGQNRIDGVFDPVKEDEDVIVNWDLYSKLYGTYGVIFILLSGIFLLALVTIGSFSFERTINQASEPMILWNAWIVIIISMVCNVYGKKYKTFLHGMNKIPLMNRWNSLFGILTLVSGFVVLSAGLNMFWFVFSTQVFVVLSVIRDKFLLRSVLDKAVKLRKIYWDKKLFKDVWKPTWRTGVGVLGSTGITEATGFIYAQYANPGSLASYLLALRFINFISTVSKAPFYSKLPVYNKLRAKVALEDLTRITKKGIVFALVVFIFCTLTIGIFTNPILKLIDSNIEFVSLYFWFALSFVWYVDRHDSMHAQIYSTTNKIPFYITIIITGLVNLGLIILLIDTLGIWTFVVAAAVSNLLINNWWNVMVSLKSLKTNKFKYLVNSFILPTVVYILSILLVLAFA